MKALAFIGILNVFAMGHMPTGNGMGTYHISVTRITKADPAPKGAIVYNVNAEIAAEDKGVVKYSSCTRGCGHWNFGCPGKFREDIKWDEQDDIGAPLYHQEMVVEAGNDCKHAWTIWRDVYNCATYQLAWHCVYPIDQGQYWDGKLTNWSVTQFNWVYPIPGACELDTLKMYLITGPKGRITGQAKPPTASNC